MTQSNLQKKIGLAFHLALITLLVTACGNDKDAAQPGAGGGGQWGGRSGGRPGGNAAIPVKAETVERGAIAAFVQTHARLEAERWVDVVARTQGLATCLAVEEGDRVAAGDLLVRLDQEELSLRLLQVEVSLEQAQSNLDRTKALFERGLVSEEEHDNANNQIKNIQVSLREARLNLEYADIRAPIGGTVMLRQVELGDMVRDNQTVFAIADLEPLLARIYLPEKRMHQVRLGQQAKLQIDAFPDRSFSGTVRMINPGVNPQSGTVKVTLEIPADPIHLKPGIFATVRIITEEHPQALIIPKKALILETDEDDVFVFDQGKARRAKIDIGFVDGDRVEVLSGLSDGDQVITVGQEGLKDGATVRLAGARSEAPEATDQGGETPGQAWGENADKGNAAAKGGKANGQKDEAGGKARGGNKDKDNTVAGASKP
jgi:membrane fusion protein (multidrug efflux system)